MLTTIWSRARPIAIGVTLAAIAVVGAGCTLAEHDENSDSGSSSSEATAPSQNAEDVLIGLAEIDTLVESFRIREKQVDSGFSDNVSWMQTNSTLREYQAPDRARITFYATEYVRDLDGDGVFEDQVAGGSSCEIQDAVTIAATFYERCDDSDWTVTQLSRDYSMPVQNADDLLAKVRELEELQVLPQESIDGRDMYVFQGAIPGMPAEIYQATRTVWVDKETALIRRIVEVIRWEESPADEPADMVGTEDYGDYNDVVIVEPLS